MMHSMDDAGDSHHEQTAQIAAAKRVIVEQRDWPIAETRIPDPSTNERPCRAAAIEYGDPDRSFAAIVADVPDLPPEEAEDSEGAATKRSEPPAPAAATLQPSQKPKSAKGGGKTKPPEKATDQAAAKVVGLNGLEPKS